MAQHKLYTEEQVRDAIKSALDGFGIGGTKDTIDIIVSNLTPIELPSDDAIENEAHKQWGNVHRTGVLGFIEGAKWMREQILNK